MNSSDALKLVEQYQAALPQRVAENVASAELCIQSAARVGYRSTSFTSMYGDIEKREAIEILRNRGFRISDNKSQIVNISW